MTGAPWCARALVEPLIGRGAPAGAHPGLVFDRYPPVQPAAGIENLDSRDIAVALEEFRKSFERSAGLGEAALLAAHGHLARVPRVESGTFQSVARFATGLGTSHLMDNGFTFHPTVGCPYISGSGVKGLCRAEGTLEGRDEDVRRICGPATDAEARAAGTVIFLAALPERWPSLEVDILNCHHPDYYGRAERRHDPVWPSETENPVPVYFLTVAAGTRWTFRLAPTSRASTEDVATAFELLEHGLSYLGVGAKTAVGYGQMTR